MTKKLKTYTEQKNIHSLNKDIVSGNLVIPKFQRNFVWNMSKILRLYESIIKDYPISSLIIYKSKEEINCVESFGDYKLNVNSNNYLIDGQQRLLSLFGVLNGVETDKISFKNIQLDIDKLLLYFENPNQEIMFFTVTKKEGKNRVNLHNLLTKHDYYSEIKDKVDREKRILLKIALNKVVDRFKNYVIPISVVEFNDLFIATTIFNRLNSTGTSLSKEDIYIAKMYRVGKFSLRKELDEIKDKHKYFKQFTDNDIMSIVNFLLRDKQHTSYYKIKFDELYQNMDNIKKSLDKAIELLTYNYNIKQADQLPFYNSLLYVTYLYFKQTPTKLQENKLLQLILILGLEEELDIDMELFSIILNSSFDDNQSFKSSLSTKDILSRCVMSSRATNQRNSVMRTIDCAVRSNKPKDLIHNIEFNLDDNHIQLDHVFPYSTFQKSAQNFINLIYIEDSVNNSKNNILPSLFFKDIGMKYYKDREYDLNTVLESHFIKPNMNTNGIGTTDIDVFLFNRTENIVKYIHNFLI